MSAPMFSRNFYNFGNKISHIRGQLHCPILTSCSYCTTQKQESVSKNSSLVDKFRLAQASRGKPLRPVFRTDYSDPSRHTKHQEGQFYTVPTENYLTWLKSCVPEELKQDIKTFHECSLMVRKPALEIIHYLKTANYSLPAIRYILYGNHGHGKSSTLSHIIHYCAVNKWIVIFAKWPSDWLINYKEISMSSYKPGRVDLPVESVEWLKLFRHLNGHYLKELELKTSKTYIWSKREQTEEGSSLNTIIDQGINRPKYASDCVGVVMKEIQEQAFKKGFKALVAADGLNGLWADTILRDEQRKFVPTDNFTLVHHFKKAIKKYWCNGAVVGVLDHLAQPEDRRESCLPRYILGKEGFEWLDPFIPVEVPKYSDKEIQSCLDYYIDRLWLQNPIGKTDDGKKQLIFLSDHNPLALSQACASY